MKLPLNCDVEYIEDFLDKQECENLSSQLIHEYHLDQARVCIEAAGKFHETDNYRMLFADQNLIDQNFYPEEVHGKSYNWTGELAKLKQKVESYLKQKFDLAMCIYYPNGNFFAPYHSDIETSGAHTILPSISIGEVREFSFKSIEDNETYNLDLANGSMLTMGAYCQSRYKHSLLKNPKYKNPRINITFREFGFQ